MITLHFTPRGPEPASRRGAVALSLSPLRCAAVVLLPCRLQDAVRVAFPLGRILGAVRLPSLAFSVTPETRWTRMSL